MILDVNDVTPDQLDQAARFFEEHGYVRLSGLRTAVCGAFEDRLAEAIEIPRHELQPLLESAGQLRLLARGAAAPLENLHVAASGSVAALVARADSEDADRADRAREQHVSRAVQGRQAQRGRQGHRALSQRDGGRLHGSARRLPAPSGLHGRQHPYQPTSGLTLWVALNACPESTLRLFPGSHRLGMFCHKMWKLDDPRLASLGQPPVDLEAQVGTGVLFHALLFHGTGKLGSLRRVSCDIRFFPLCGFLPSEAHFLDSRPLDMLSRHQERELGPTLLAPVLEQLTYLGEPVAVEAPPLSTLNWVNYLVELMRGQADSALPHLARFINTNLLEDPESVFTHKFHNRPLHLDRLHAVRDRVAAMMN